jgi:hypothetical protein
MGAKSLAANGYTGYYEQSSTGCPMARSFAYLLVRRDGQLKGSDCSKDDACSLGNNLNFTKWSSSQNAPKEQGRP